MFSSYVLEHLEQPDVALDRFFDWLRPGGLCALIIPDKDTAKGFATRFSPFFVHVWYYRWVKGRPTAGKPGYEPYRTFYKSVVCRKGLRAYAEARGHRVVAEIPIRLQRDDEGLVTTVATRIIKVTDKLRMGIVAATGAVFLVYLFNMILSLFDASIPFLHDSSLLGIGISLAIVAVAAFNLLLDFDFVERGVAAGAPRKIEWYAAFGLVVTIVWLYLELLGLLGRLQGRS